jgi:uncharacterized repeat protein (TIGR01451 family)
MTTASPALAHRSPSTCNTNGIALNIERSQAEVKNGDAMAFYITVSNDAAGACDLTNTTIDLLLPARDGSYNGQRVRIVTGASYQAGFTSTRIGTIPYTVALNKGVTKATVRAVFVDATLHDSNISDTSLAGIYKDISLYMTPPTINIAKEASPTSGVAPLAVTYTYTVTNTSSLDLPIANVAVTDNLCSSPTYASGDADGDGLLDKAEVWKFTCSTTHATPGIYVDTANVCGDGFLGGEHVCGGPVQATVVVTAPPAPPAQPVALASRPAACISVPKKLSVRARELTTVTVKVFAGKISGAALKLTGAGITRSGKTNSKGTATFKVRPTKKGTLTITSSSCLNAERVSVKAARKTQSRQVPRVTG